MRRLVSFLLSVVALAVLALGVAPRPAAAQTPSLPEAASTALTALRTWQAVSLTASAWDFAGSEHELGSAADTWVLARKQLAALVAQQASVDPAVLDAVWRDADQARLVATFSALSQVGVRYRRNASTAGVGFDCSGLMLFAWGQAGVGLPHQSSAQIRSTALRSLDEAEPGDLVWYPGHVMMYLGAGNAIVHAPQSGDRVHVRDASRIARVGSPLGA